MSSNKPTRSPTPGPGSSGSKLPKFLQKSTINIGRDRSKSVVDPIMQHVNNASVDSNSSSSASMSMSMSAGEPAGVATTAGTGGARHRGDRKTSSKLKGTLKELKDERIGQIASTHRERERELLDEDNGSSNSNNGGDMPVIVEPVSPASTSTAASNSSRSRTRSERPLSASSSDSHPAVSYYPSGSHTQRIPEMSMGSRLSGWFSHTFSTSSTDLSLPNILANTTPSMSGGAGSKSKSGAGLGILTAARHGKGHLDKAMRYLLDSDATPDKCNDPIWLLGVQHPGYEPPLPPIPSSPPLPPSTSASGRRSSLDIRRSSSIRNSVSSMRGATSSPEPSMVHHPNNQQKNSNAAQWPPGFYADFTSRVWLTYRSHYPPIRDQTLAQLEAEASGQAPTQPPISASPRRWNILNMGGEKGWTSDSGWGCMLRTGQSLLANALIHLHLGRDWRRPPHPVYTADYATYVKILTWFFDSTDIHCPFSVHRMALAGKDLGKDVGQWFGPSTAAGAIKTLVHAFAEAGLGVSVATDGVVYETDVLAASNAGPYMNKNMYKHSRTGTSGTSSPGATRRRRSAQQQRQEQRERQEREQQQQSMMSIWGQRPVLVLVGIRLGIDCVNPVYYDAVKALFTFPQSVGISGGRPSSSYYFVGVQADNLFYLDPHHARPTVPFRPPPTNLEGHEHGHGHQGFGSRNHHHTTHTQGQNHQYHYHQSSSPPADSPPSSYREPYAIPGERAGGGGGNANASRHVKASSSISSYASQPRVISPSTSQGSTSASMSPSGSASVSGQSIYGYDELDPIQQHYVTAYSPMELRTFHCERVRKMHLSGLDPSMLIGFLCRDERDWRDLRERVSEMSRKYKTIFAIQDEPPSWPSDSDEMGMESVSDVDIDMDEDGDGDEDGTADVFSGSPEPGADGEVIREGRKDSADSTTREASSSTDRDRERDRGRQSGEVTTEEDPLGPVTPGPSSGTQTFRDQQQSSQQHEEISMSKLEEDTKGMGLEEEPVDLLDDDDDEWVDTESTPAPRGHRHDPTAPTPRARPREAPNFPVLPVSVVESTATTASYVSASSSYSSLLVSSDPVGETGSGSGSGSRKPSPSPGGTKDQERDKEAKKDEEKDKEIKPRRSAKMRSSKSAGGRREGSSTSQGPAQTQEYVPFPVVDDREPDDSDFHELSSHSLSPGAGGSQRSGSGPCRRRRTGSVDSESQNRTPIASFVTQADPSLATSANNLGNNNRNSNGNGYGYNYGGYPSENGSGANVAGTGYRIRNVFARDGGRTQSGGVRGIVTSDLDDASDS